MIERPHAVSSTQLHLYISAPLHLCIPASLHEDMTAIGRHGMPPVRACGHMRRPHMQARK
jgi:hypothetical protein